jgi:integrase
VATLSTEKYVRKDGTTITTYRVLIGGGRRQRHTIRLGDVSEAIAIEAKKKIEALETAKITDTDVSKTTAKWVSVISDTIHEKLAKAGLVEPRQTVEVEEWTLGRLLADRLATRDDVARRTEICHEYSKKKLLEFFGKERTLSTIHEHDADEYQRWLLKKHAQATASREVKRARQFFKVAVRRRLITANPFAEVKAGTQANPSRKHYVSRETIEAVLAACPNNDWRLIFALARYAGLRTPSELEEFKWSDVNWERGRFTVHVPKKAHIAGQETRVVPIFAELRPYLERAFSEAPEGSVYVVPRARGGRNLRRYAEQLIERASVTKWPKLFNNLRASCETDLMRRYPAHVVHAWIGHSATVAEAHYLQVTDADYEAAGGGFGSVSIPAHNPAHYPAHSGADSKRLVPSEFRQTREDRGIAERDDQLKYSRQEANNRGKRRGKAQSRDLPGTQPGTISADEAAGDDLAELARVLARLTPEERANLMAVVKAVSRPAGRRARS